MGKKAVMTAMTITALLIFLFLISFIVNPVKAQFLGSVFINPDGSVAGTNNIQREGDVYILSGNISGGIQIQKSHVVLDGAGYAVLGNGEGRGIDLSNARGEDPSRPEVDNVTVKNLKIIDFYHGVDNANTDNNTFIKNYIEDCQNSFWIIGSSNNTIIGNTLKNASVAINYAGVSTFFNNSFVDSMVNVWLSYQPVIDGNFWSDYTSRYPNATEIDNSGVWDTPYKYWESFVDNHPLVDPISTPILPTQTPTQVPTPLLSPSPTPNIEPTTSIPEFQTLIALPLLLAAMLLILVVWRRHFSSNKTETSAIS